MPVAFTRSQSPAPPALKRRSRWCGHQEVVTTGGVSPRRGAACGKGLGGGILVSSFAAPSPAPRKMPGADFVPCIRGGFPLSSQTGFCGPEPRRIRTGQPSPCREASGSTAAPRSDLHSEGRQIPSRRRCAKIAFAARVKLYPSCHLLLKQRVCLQVTRLTRALPTGRRAPSNPPAVSAALPWPGHLVSLRPSRWPPPSHFSHSGQRGLSKMQIRSYHSPAKSPPPGPLSH